jgi:hypothetical protein
MTAGCRGQQCSRVLSFDRHSRALLKPSTVATGMTILKAFEEHHPLSSILAEDCYLIFTILFLNK